MARRRAAASTDLEALVRIHGKEPARNPGSTPLDHLVFGIIAAGVPAARARTAYDAVTEAYVDRNELRVAEVHEILPHLAALQDPAVIAARAALLRRVLQGLFDALDRVRIEITSPEEGEEVRRVLGGMSGLSPGLVAALVCRATEDQPVVPNRAMVRAAQRLGMLPKGGTETRQAAALSALGGNAEGRVLVTFLLTEHGETCCGEKGSGCDACPVCSPPAEGKPRKRSAR